MRSVTRCLSLALYGKSLLLTEMTSDPAIRGLGLSDWDGYAGRLARLFSYQNTFFDSHPRLDITKPPRELLGRLDFLIASDVFEHVTPPVELAFRGAFALLKPGGKLIFSVPYTLDASTVEHFPDLTEFDLLNVGDEYYLRNRRPDGSLELRDGLVFHGGPGQTLEMRIFCEADLLAQLERAGFTEITIHRDDHPATGVIHAQPWSLPITAQAGHHGGEKSNLFLRAVPASAEADQQVGGSSLTAEDTSTAHAAHDCSALQHSADALLPHGIQKVQAVSLLADRFGIAIGNPWQSSTVGHDIARLAEELPIRANPDVQFIPHRDVPGAREARLYSTVPHRVAPPGFSNARHSMFAGVPETEYQAGSPDFNVLTVADGYFCHFLDAPVVVASDGRTVIRDYSSNYSGLIHFHPHRLRDCIAEAPYIDGVVVPIADDVQSANICHWMLDWLPRLAFLHPRIRDPNVFVVTSRISAEFQTETLRLCGVTSDRIVQLENFQAVRARELLVPSNLREISHPAVAAAPWALAYLRSALGLGALREAGDAVGAPTKIYISRQDAGGRRIRNEPELVARLADAGFRELVLSRLPVVQQIAAFARAECVIGLHGAGLTHSVFMPPDGRVLEILPSSYAILTYYCLAAALGLEYSSYVAERIVPGPDASFDDVEIDAVDFDLHCWPFYI